VLHDTLLFPLGIIYLSRVLGYHTVRGWTIILRETVSISYSLEIEFSTAAYVEFEKMLPTFLLCKRGSLEQIQKLIIAIVLGDSSEELP
jgi:hypothetical protein